VNSMQQNTGIESLEQLQVYDSLNTTGVLY
jgi:hypothetical protein